MEFNSGFKGLTNLNLLNKFSKDPQIPN